jgi:hypothetical protein
MLNFKKELEKSEQKREQLSDHLEVLVHIYKILLISFSF